MWQYPEPRKQTDVVDNYFGTKVADPYRWMEDPDSDETKEFVSNQNAISRPYLSGSPVRDKFHKRQVYYYTHGTSRMYIYARITHSIVRTRNINYHEIP